MVHHGRVAQLEEASGLGPECWEFESLHGYHLYSHSSTGIEHSPTKGTVTGSNPVGSTIPYK